MKLRYYGHAALLVFVCLVAVHSVYATGVRQGYAARYRPGLMEDVAVRRGITADHPVASPDHALRTLLQVCSKRACINATVVDVCHPDDCAAIRKRGIVVELAHVDAKTICGSTNEPPRQCPVTVRKRS